MAYVVKRPGGRWEIRESLATSAGPRSRTLAGFRELTPEILVKAQARALSPFHEDDLVRSAARAGATVAVSSADRLARSLLAEVAAGRRPTPGLRAVLRDALGDDARGVPDSVRWIGATLEQRAEALHDLLLLADRVPPSSAARLRRQPRRSFPRLDTASA